MFKKIKSLWRAAEEISQQPGRRTEPSAGAEREIERLWNSALIFEEEADWTAAADLYRRLDSIDPENIRWLKDLAFVLSEDQAWEEAIAIYRQVLERLPEDV